MEELNEIIICSILNRLKIDAIATVSEQLSWADADEDGKVSGGVHYFLELDDLKETRERLVKEILEEFNRPEILKYRFNNSIKYSKVHQLQENEKHIKEIKFFGINSKNKTIEPISEKLDKNIKNLLPEKVYNFIIAKCLVDENHKHILSLNGLDLILNYWKNNLPDIDNDCWSGDGNSQYFWEVLFKENNQINVDYGGEFGAGELNFYNHSQDLLKYDFWKVFTENQSISL
jgi:hypothetical protein